MVRALNVQDSEQRKQPDSPSGSPVELVHIWSVCSERWHWVKLPEQVIWQNVYHCISQIKTIHIIGLSISYQLTYIVIKLAPNIHTKHLYTLCVQDFFFSQPLLVMRGEPLSTTLKVVTTKCSKLLKQIKNCLFWPLQKISMGQVCYKVPKIHD